MSGYTTLFSNLLASTVWRETKETRLLWITLLAMADRHGIADASVPGLADFARLSVDETRASLATLAAPDPESRTPDFEGRRITAVERGWRILNHAKYRAQARVDERREYKRVKQAHYRANGTPPAPTSVVAPPVRPARPRVTRATPTAPPPAQAEATPTAPPTPAPTPEAVRVMVRTPEPEPEPEPVFMLVPPPDAESEAEAEMEAAEATARETLARFARFWAAYPRHTAKSLALAAFRRLGVSETLLDIILVAIATQAHSLQWTRESGAFIPHPATWLNQARWNDEMERAPAATGHRRRLGPALLQQAWYEECASLHGGSCETSPAHRLRCQLDDARREDGGP